MNRASVPTARPVRPLRTHRTPARWIAGLALLAVPTALLVAVPLSAGSSWAEVGRAIGQIRWAWLIGIAVVWIVGLVAHTLVLTASLPGLSSRRALSLNMAGSAVANAVPLGGPLSLGITTAMITSWGFPPVALGAFLTLSTVWNVLARVLAGVLGLGWLALAQPGTLDATQVRWVVAASIGAVLLVGIALARVASAAWVGGAAGRLVDRWSRLRGRPEAGRRRGYALVLVRIRHRVLRLAVRSWQQLSLGMIGYLLSLCLLLGLCLHALHAPQAVALVAAAVGVERLVTAIPLTPGGSGVAELGLVACLTAGGTPPVAAVTAALLYRLFTFFLEIPVGLAVAVGWVLGRRRTAAAARTGVATVTSGGAW